MRVLHVIPSVAARYGGPSTAISPMCRALMKLGVEPTIVTTDADGTQNLPVPIGAATSWEGVPAIFFRRDFSESFKYSRGLSRWVRANAGRFDVVHIHAVLSHACLAAAAASRKAGVPYVIRPLGTLAPWSLQQHRLRKQLLFALGGRRAVRSAAAVHCTSEREKQDVAQALNAVQGVVIPLGIDSAYLDVAPLPIEVRESDPYALILSRLHHKKNLEALISAFLDATERESASRWRLIIAGTGDAEYVASLEEIARKRHAESKVTFVGWVDGERKEQLIRRASLFVLVSMHENFGVSLLESLAAGIPALVSDQVDLAAAVGAADAGWVVGTSRAALTAALTEALAAGPRRVRMGLAARKLAEEYAWPGVAARLVALYRTVLRIADPLQSAQVVAVAAGQSSGRVQR